MTSVEIPYSIACALPSLTVIDITNDVAHELGRNGHARDGIAYVSPTEETGLVRVNERESGFFEDLEDLLERLVPFELRERERLVQLLLGPRTEQIPFRGAELCLGTWQRILLLGFDGSSPGGWTLTALG
ncbi:MAG TPA: YjbQ family protein [Gaiellaceae bacterium]